MGKSKMFIDFLSGYNPAEGFASCDYIYSPNLDVVFDIDTYELKGITTASVRLLRCRNALHHVRDLCKLVKEFHRVLASLGKIIVIECKPEVYDVNVLHDTIWYRGIMQRDEVWFSKTYRDYAQIFCNNGFKLISTATSSLKEIKVFSKI